MLILKLMFLAARNLVSLDIERVSTRFCYVINIDYESVVVSILLKTNFQLNVFTHESLWIPDQTDIKFSYGTIRCKLHEKLSICVFQIRLKFHSILFLSKSSIQFQYLGLS